MDIISYWERKLSEDDREYDRMLETLEQQKKEEMYFEVIREREYKKIKAELDGFYEALSDGTLFEIPEDIARGIEKIRNDHYRDKDVPDIIEKILSDFLEFNEKHNPGRIYFNEQL